MSALAIGEATLPVIAPIANIIDVTRAIHLDIAHITCYNQADNCQNFPSITPRGASQHCSTPLGVIECQHNRWPDSDST